MRDADMRKLVAGLHDYLGRALRPLHQRIKVLEAERTKTLADVYCGVWREKKFARGSLVTYAGSLWLAVQDTDGRPGQTHLWQLITRAGRDVRWTSR